MVKNLSAECTEPTEIMNTSFCHFRGFRIQSKEFIIIVCRMDFWNFFYIFSSSRSVRSLKN